METKKPLNAQAFVPYEARKKKPAGGFHKLGELCGSVFLPLLFILGVLLLFVTSGRARPVPMGPDMMALCLFSTLSCLFLLFGGKLPRFSLWNLFGLGVASYFFVRAGSSPVYELGRIDGSLLIMAFFFYPLGTALGGMKRGTFWLGTTLVLLFLLNGISLALQKGSHPLFLLGYPESVAPGKGIFTYHTMFGHFMGAAGLFALFKGIWNPHLKARLFWLSLAVLGLLGVLESSSRGAIIALGSGIIVGGFFSLFYFYKVKREHFLRYCLLLLGVLALLGLLGGMALLTLASERPITGIDDPLSAVFYSPVRTELSLLAWLLSQKAGLWGLGARSFEYEYFSVAQHLNYWFTESINLIHNEYAQIRVEYGLIGLWLLFLLFFSHLFKAAFSLLKLPKKDEKSPYPEPLSQYALSLIGAAAALTYAFTHAYTDFVWHILPIACLSAFLLGLLLTPAPKLLEKTPSPCPPSQDSLARLLALKELFIRLVFIGVLAFFSLSFGRETRDILPLYFLRQELLSLPPSASLEEKVALKKHILSHSVLSTEVLDYVRDYLEADRQAQGGNGQSWDTLLEVEPSLEKICEFTYPQNPHAQLTYAYVLAEKQNYKKADQTYARLIAQTSEAGPHFDSRTPYASFLLKQASHYEVLGLLPEAHSCVKRALKELELGSEKRNPHTPEKRALFLELQRIEKHFKEQNIPLSAEIEEKKLY